MKKTIKRILLEEIKNQNILESLKYLTKIAKKKYPFVEDMKLTDVAQLNFYVVIYVNVEKVIDYYNMPLKDYYTSEIIKKSNTLFPYPFSFLNHGDLNDEQVLETNYNKYREILEYLREAYSYFPTEFKEQTDVHYSTEDDYKEFNIDGFKISI